MAFPAKPRSGVALLVWCVFLPCGESTHDSIILTRGSHQATGSGHERLPWSSRNCFTATTRRQRHSGATSRLSSSTPASIEAVLLLRGGIDTNTENTFEQEPEGGKREITAPVVGEGEVPINREASDSSPHIETVYMQSGDGSEVISSRSLQEDLSPAQASENHMQQEQPPKQRLPRVDKVVLPSDSSFVQSPAQLRAFVKRRGPPGGSGNSLPQQQQQHSSSQQQPNIVDDSSATEQTQEATVESTSASPIAMLDRTKKPMHLLDLPMVHVLSGILRLVSHPAVLFYCAALLGTSVGFVQFLYFSTVGYASGIALPVGVQMLANRAAAPLLSSANLSSALVLLWGVRLAAFLLWREYLNWPALHAHMRHVKPPPLVPTQLLGWVVYSGLYLCVASPVLFQQQHVRNATASAAEWTGGGGTKRPIVHHHSKVALVLQVVGLLLEATADLQKSLFKAQYRHDWCNVGFWRYCTHPNYLGEALFWVGTHLNGLSHLVHSRHQRSLLALMAQLLASGAGLSFVLSVLRGAVLHSEDTQRRKYGTDPTFVAFQETYGLFGYRLWKQSIQPALRRALASSMEEVFDEAAS